MKLEDDVLFNAALAASLSPTSASKLERLLCIHPHDMNCYLWARNHILSLWFKNPTVLLTLNEVLNSTTLSTQMMNMIKIAFAFLHRYRFINNGIIKLNSNPSSKTSNRIPRICIIGAGMAGLSTAREIQNMYNGYPSAISPEIIILEAKQVPGGRISTLDQDNVDVGAQFIYGFSSSNPLHTILNQQLCISVHSIDPSTVHIYDTDGNAIDDSTYKYAKKIFMELVDSCCKIWLIGGNLTQVSAQRKNELTETQGAGYDPSLGKTFDYFLHKYMKTTQLNEVTIKLIHWHLANIEFSYSNILDWLSVYHWNQDSTPKIDGKCMVIGGFAQIPKAYAKDLDIRYNKNVLSISVGSQEEDLENATGIVKVVCQDGIIYRCDAVVVTVPIGALKKSPISFQPLLPKWKSDSIRLLGMGYFTNVILTFPKLFWDSTVDMFGSLNQSIDERGKYFMFWNMFQTTEQPILSVIISGKSAKDMIDTSQEVIVQEIIDVLVKIFKLSVPPNPCNVYITKWNTDEFSMGCYSSITPSSNGKDYEKMAEPICNKIFWAGEATHREFPGTVQGAILSGRRVASEIGNTLLGHVLNNEALHEYNEYTLLESLFDNNIKPKIEKDSGSNSCTMDVDCDVLMDVYECAYLISRGNA